MGFLFKSVLFLLLLLLGGAALTLVLLVEDQPTVPGEALVPADLSAARVFIENSDPRRLAPGELSDFTINEQDLELLLNYLLDELRGGSSQVALDAGVAELQLSARLPDNPLGTYLNLHIVLKEASGTLALDLLQIGQVSIPGWITDPLLQRAHAELELRVPEYRAALAAIDTFRIDPERLHIAYRWHPELFEQISSRGRDLLLSEAERERLLAHDRQLATLLDDPALPARLPLVDLLRPMFGFARDRQGDPVEENRAVLVVLSLYASGSSVTSLLGAPADVPEPPHHEFLLSGRLDFARHFLISAGLTVSAGTGVAESLGLLKEVDDAQDGGSGFSFTDLGADQTGIRLAELAVAGPDQARALQARLADTADESLFMADFTDFPEFLSGEAFEEAYGGVGEPTYDAVLLEIDTRITGMPLFSP